MTRIDGVDIHFIHVRSAHEDALPLIVTHGWPGSTIEQLKIIGPLMDPTSHGADAADAFHLVIPSLPGHGFSAKPIETGWDPVRIASAWAELMTRLGYECYVAQGGDWGNAVTEQLALLKPAGLLGIHTNMPATVPPDVSTALGTGGPKPDGMSADEDRAFEILKHFFATGIGYAQEMSNRPQTLYALEDLPVGLAAWMIDDDERSYALIERAFVGPAGGLSRDDILDNVTHYWLTSSGVSSARLYWESHLAFFDIKGVDLPVGVTVFPDELYPAPKTWAEKAYPKLVHYNVVAEGGHFAAWEQPLCSRTRSGRRSARSGDDPRTPPAASRPASRDSWARSCTGSRARMSSCRWRAGSGVRWRDGLARLGPVDACRSPRAHRPRRLLDIHLRELASDAAVPQGLGHEVRGRGLTIVGVHTPEFDFEHDRDNVIAMSGAQGVAYPIALDNDYGVWRAFSNHFWPAIYIADTQGRIRYHHFGEGEYAMTEMVIQQLLREAGVGDVPRDLVAVEPRGLEVAADWGTLRTPETYVGYGQASGFAQEDVASFGTAAVYELVPLRLNEWALAGTWDVARHAGIAIEPAARIAFRFQARDLNLVMSPTSRGASIPFRVFLDGVPASTDRGVDLDSTAAGSSPSSGPTS